MNSSATLTGCDDIIKRLREAIAAGPTPGQWRIRESGRHGTSVDGVFNVGVAWCGTNTTVSMEGSHSISSSEAMANASLIAAASPDNIAALLDRLDAAEREVERLRCNAMQWRKPGPVTAEHPLECLIVVPALRQADGDWWIEGSKFLADDAPIAWCADTSIARAALAQYGIVDRQEDAA